MVDVEGKTRKREKERNVKESGERLSLPMR
jgi:hypothetical protein